MTTTNHLQRTLTLLRDPNTTRPLTTPPPLPDLPHLSWATHEPQPTDRRHFAQFQALLEHDGHTTPLTVRLYPGTTQGHPLGDAGVARVGACGDPAWTDLAVDLVHALTRFLHDTGLDQGPEHAHTPETMADTLGGREPVEVRHPARGWVDVNGHRMSAAAWAGPLADVAATFGPWMERQMMQARPEHGARASGPAAAATPQAGGHHS